MTEAIEHLRQVRIFHDLTDEELGDLARLADEMEISPKQMIFREKTPGTAIFVVLEGGVRIYKEVSPTTKKTLATLGPGESFGEFSIFDGLPRSATVVATKKGRLLRLDAEDLDLALGANPHLANTLLRAVIKELSLRLRRGNEEVADWVAWASTGG